MANDFVLQEMDLYNADGVDFVPVMTQLDNIQESSIIESYTRSEWLKQKYMPKTGRYYWKRGADGLKVYIDPRTGGRK